MEVAFHVTTSFGMTHVILETTTRTRTLKGGGFGLTPPQQKSGGPLKVHKGGATTCNCGRPCGPTLTCHVHDLRL